MAATAEQLTVPEWTLGHRLQRAREHAGVRTHGEMAARLKSAGVEKCSDSSISNWESNTTRPRDLIGVIEAYEKVTGVPQWWLLGINYNHVQTGANNVNAKIMRLVMGTSKKAAGVNRPLVAALESAECGR